MVSRLKRLLRALERDDVRSISRRYFISNGFDGALTSVGVAVGSYLSGVPDGLTVFKIGMGAAIGLGTSGVWSVWEIERAEKRAELKRIEHAMLTDLDETRIQRQKAGARQVNALMSGIGPVIGVVFPMTPFLFEESLLSMRGATLISIGVAVSILFVFGAYLADISEQNWIVAGARMGLAGIVVALLNIILPG
ncbi:VIT1/CCC1 transporter family protein [Halogeometricum sp. S1BR25-6]|uniref:VIT1/CCC1 transporter family protein n=1 Tax=Halogeometricum salsisoli TaxID=2950536 RepID=A0ABU2GLV7_9EURY|nr:VIT1/CCC1 transporter family protein [Halogeometricum sp. S1BR25-6]MDS0301043.1 VIT1/CCC1 transporter family protein [Halogeometricum sp. S1BR25-6]